MLLLSILILLLTSFFHESNCAYKTVNLSKWKQECHHIIGELEREIALYEQNGSLNLDKLQENLNKLIRNGFHAFELIIKHGESSDTTTLLMKLNLSDAFESFERRFQHPIVDAMACCRALSTEMDQETLNKLRSLIAERRTDVNTMMTEIELSSFEEQLMIVKEGGEIAMETLDGFIEQILNIQNGLSANNDPSYFTDMEPFINARNELENLKSEVVPIRWDQVELIVTSMIIESQLNVLKNESIAKTEIQSLNMKNLQKLTRMISKEMHKIERRINTIPDSEEIKKELRNKLDGVQKWFNGKMEFVQYALSKKKLLSVMEDEAINGLQKLDSEMAKLGREFGEDVVIDQTIRQKLDQIAVGASQIYAKLHNQLVGMGIKLYFLEERCYTTARGLDQYFEKKRLELESNISLSLKVVDEWMPTLTYAKNVLKKYFLDKTVVVRAIEAGKEHVAWKFRRGML